MNKKRIILLLLAFGCLNGISQTKRIICNVWHSNERLSGSEIWINSDSTYFLTYSGCTETSVSKGLWSLNKDTFKLSQSIDFELYPKVTFSKNENFKLVFLDNNNLPIEGLKLVFVGDTSNLFQTSTKENGIIELHSKKYNKFYIDGLENKYFETTKIDSSIDVHLSIEKSGEYIFRFNYPSSIITNGQRTENFFVNNETLFLKTKKNELIEIGCGRIYKKKY
jgi:hypothetical protein